MSMFYEPDDADKLSFWEKTHWIDKNGTRHEIRNMSTRHINNVVRMIFNKGYFKHYQDSPLEREILSELERRDDHD